MEQDKFNLVALFIYTAYVRRFIQKEWTFVPKVYYGVLMKCHYLYMENPKLNKISLKRVKQVMNSLTKTELHRMLNAFK